MPATVEMLKQKIARLQRELGEVSAALDDLAEPTGPNNTPTGKPPEGTSARLTRDDPFAGIRFTDPQELLPAIDRAFAEMGIDVTQPAPTPEEVQEFMRREGIRPEDNILSRGIIEAREE